MKRKEKKIWGLHKRFSDSIPFPRLLPSTQLHMKATPPPKLHTSTHFFGSSTHVLNRPFPQYKSLYIHMYVFPVSMHSLALQLSDRHKAWRSARRGKASWVLCCLSTSSCTASSSVLPPGHSINTSTAKTTNVCICILLLIYV